MKPAAPAQWNSQRDATMRRLKQSGQSDRAIARELGLTVNQVRKRRRVLGEVRTSVGRPNALPPEVATVRDLRQRGYSIAAIAKKLNLGYGWVRSTIEQHEQEQAAKPPAAVDDDALVARLMADGGMPRFHWPDPVRKPALVLLLGANDRPWFDPDRRKAAA